MVGGVRISICVLLVVMLLPVAFAFSLHINDENSPETLRVSPGQKIAIGYVAQPGSIIGDVQIESDNSALEAMLNKEIMTSTFSVLSAEDTSFMLVPQDAPAVDAQMTVRVAYKTPDYQREVYAHTMRVQIVNASDNDLPWWAKGIPEDALVYVMARFAGYELPRLSFELQYTDLTSEQLVQLGISPQEYTSLLSQLAKAKREGLSTQEVSKRLPTFTQVSQITRELSVPSNTFGEQLDVQPRVTQTITVYEVTYQQTTITVSKSIISVHADDEFLASGEIHVVVPKEMAQDVDLMNARGFYEVIERDPVVKWSLKNVPQNQVKDYALTTSGDAQNFEVLAQAAAEEPGFITKLLMMMFGEA